MSTPTPLCVSPVCARAIFPLSLHDALQASAQAGDLDTAQSFLYKYLKSFQKADKKTLPTVAEVRALAGRQSLEDGNAKKEEGMKERKRQSLEDGNAQKKEE